MRISNALYDAMERELENVVPHVRAYCDGGVYGASRSAVAASWAYRIVGEPGMVLVQAGPELDDLKIRQMAVAGGEPPILMQGSGVLYPTEKVDTLTNNYAEYVAAIHALEAVPMGSKVLLCSDSDITLGRLLRGWATNGLPEALIRRGYWAVHRHYRVVGSLHDGHPTKLHLRLGLGKRGNPVSEHNVWCDQECARLLADIRARLENENDKDAE